MDKHIDRQADTQTYKHTLAQTNTHVHTEIQIIVYITGSVVPLCVVKLFLIVHVSVL